MSSVSRSRGSYQQCGHLLPGCGGGGLGKLLVALIFLISRFLATVACMVVSNNLVPFRVIDRQLLHDRASASKLFRSVSYLFNVEFVFKASSVSSLRSFPMTQFRIL